MSAVFCVQVNLTASCNFGCSCDINDVQPVCGNNGLTYFSPCHAGCTSLLSSDNYTNCACVTDNFGEDDVSEMGSSSMDVIKVPVASAGTKRSGENFVLFSVKMCVKRFSSCAQRIR
jgi:hypothetical protein